MGRLDFLPGRALDCLSKVSRLWFPCKALRSRDGRLRVTLAPDPSCRPSFLLFSREWRPAIPGSESKSARKVVLGGILISRETHHPLPVPVPQDRIGESAIRACICFLLRPSPCIDSNDQASRVRALADTMFIDASTHLC